MIQRAMSSPTPCPGARAWIRRSRASSLARGVDAGAKHLRRAAPISEPSMPAPVPCTEGEVAARPENDKPPESMSRSFESPEPTMVTDPVFDDEVGMVNGRVGRPMPSATQMPVLELSRAKATAIETALSATSAGVSGVDSKMTDGSVDWLGDEIFRWELRDGHD